MRFSKMGPKLPFAVFTVSIEHPKRCPILDLLPPPGMSQSTSCPWYRIQCHFSAIHIVILHILGYILAGPLGLV